MEERQQEQQAAGSLTQPTSLVSLSTPLLMQTEQKQF